MKLSQHPVREKTKAMRFFSCERNTRNFNHFADAHTSRPRREAHWPAWASTMLASDDATSATLTFGLG